MLGCLALTEKNWAKISPREHLKDAAFVGILAYKWATI
jgi:hypothetical protein